MLLMGGRAVSAHIWILTGRHKAEVILKYSLSSFNHQFDVDVISCPLTYPWRSQQFMFCLFIINGHSIYSSLDNARLQYEVHWQINSGRTISAIGKYQSWHKGFPCSASSWKNKQKWVSIQYRHKNLSVCECVLQVFCVVSFCWIIIRGHELMTTQSCKICFKRKKT